MWILYSNIRNNFVKQRIADCATWMMKLFFQLFNPLNAELKPICHLLALLGAHHILHVRGIRVKKISAIITHILLSCRNKICWFGRTPAPLIICHTHATATKFPTPFSLMLHGHHILAINSLNFTMNFYWSSPFCPQKPNIWLHLFLCSHTHTHSTVHIAELRRPRKLRILSYESASI